jgi:predicted dehydrogenase
MLFMNSHAEIRVAILGCGMAAETHYIPSLQRISGSRVTLLVDPDTQRRNYLASRFEIDRTHHDATECYDLFDAAIVALPTTLRRSACIELLQQRKPVLVEQPMALSANDCDAIVRAAEQSGTLLALGLMRRFLWSHRFAHSLIKSGCLGQVESFDFREGFTSIQPGTSDVFFRKELAGGGVLSDAGVHVLDSMLHWLGDFSEFEYCDDALGGVEANALLNLRLKGGQAGFIELSRTRQLRNTAIVRFERGTIEVGLGTNTGKLTLTEQPYVFGGSVTNSIEPASGQGYPDLVGSMIENFVEATRSREKVEADGRQARSVIELIEACYGQRRPLQSTWAYQDSTKRT